LRDIGEGKHYVEELFETSLRTVLALGEKRRMALRRRRRKKQCTFCMEKDR
jgi:hypothetical protein